MIKPKNKGQCGPLIYKLLKETFFICSYVNKEVTKKFLSLVATHNTTKINVDQ